MPVAAETIETEPTKKKTFAGKFTKGDRKGPSNQATAAFINQIRQSKRIEDQEDLYQALQIGVGGQARGAESGGTIWEIAPGLIPMWRPLTNGDFMRCVVPEDSLLNNLDTGWLAFCPYCGEDCGPELNACTEKEPKRFRRCPICRAAIEDDGNPAEDMEVSDDPNEIRDPNLTASTPEIRTLVRLRDHMVWRHPRETQAYLALFRSLGDTARMLDDRTGLSGREVTISDRIPVAVSGGGELTQKREEN